MATAPVVVAPKETAIQKIESVLDHIGSGIEKFNNALVNIGTAELPTVQAFLPPNVSAALAEFLPAAATELASVDAKYASIGKSSAPWLVKATEVAAVSGVGLLAILSKFGLTVAEGQLPVLLAAVPTIISNINLTTATAAPVAPTTTPAA